MAVQDNTNKMFLAVVGGEFQKVSPSLQVVLANTIYMYSLYKKYHWHVAGEDFYQYHLLFDKHADAQLALADAVAERLRTLGSLAEAMPVDVERLTSLNETAAAKHDVQIMVHNLLVAHDAYIARVRDAIEIASVTGDEGTQDLLVSEVLRTHELQVWFLRSSQRGSSNPKHVRVS